MLWQNTGAQSATWVYDDAKEKVKFTDLPKEWVCPVCGAPKSAFVLLAEQEEEKES